MAGISPPVPGPVTQGATAGPSATVASGDVHHAQNPSPRVRPPLKKCLNTVSNRFQVKKFEASAGLFASDDFLA
ncbi:unnamed protein product [Darwinula stevensoni]|uniref:Uncharacterized protein n=1 Tax=Darwinula stevensoni TaxID=69355 RepID=A0A7R8X9F8_9CRUS|nr:unnamed protein product [Darwinula stevensoni]CAG0889639.1 unnamed protein product [Darwinula stevensoni]